MNIEEFRLYCLSKKGVSESFPFDEVTLVFKVANKIFAITSLDTTFYINLKCEPEKAIELRERYDSVRPGWHMNKKHWNTIDIDDSISNKLICEWIDNSYDLILKKLTKKQKIEFENS